MNINQLRFIIAVVETGSFSKAAESCFVTQPSLSNAISQIESELGGKIFKRSTRQVNLSSFGEHVLPMVRAILTSIDDLKESAENYSNPEHKLIRIGMTPLTNISLLNTVIDPYRKKYPEVEITYKECLMDDLNTRLLNNQIDLAFVEKNQISKSVKSHPFYTEPLYYLPQENDDFKQQRNAITLKETKDDTFILAEGCGLSDLLRDLFKKNKLDLNEYRGKALSYKVIEEWASLGIGSAILPRSKIAKNNDTAIPLYIRKKNNAQITLAVCWHEESQNLSHIGNFTNHIKKISKAIVDGVVA